jgi:hypothetical protein
MRTALKKDCINCGHRISFRPNDYGNVSFCPKCAQTVLLYPNSDFKGATLKYYLRWLAIIPGAIAAYALIALLALLGAIAEGDTKNSISLHIAIPANCGASAFAVWAGAKIAPAKRFGIAVMLTILFAMICAVSLTVHYLASGFNGLIWPGFCAVLGIGSALITTFAMDNRTPEEKALKEQERESKLLLIEARNRIEMKEGIAKNPTGNINN